MSVFKLNCFAARRILGFANPIVLRKSQHTSIQNDEYQLVYSMNYARIGAAVNSLKIKQTILTGLAYPVCLSLELQNVVPHGTYSIPCLVIVTGLNVAFYSVGQLFYRLVGKVYWSEKAQLVKIAYVGFFGKREEIEVPIDDITSLEDKRSGILYTRFEVINPKLSLKINERYFDYGDFEQISKIFGGGFGSK